jgi:hypothetical protein
MMKTRFSWLRLVGVGVLVLGASACDPFAGGDNEHPTPVTGKLFFPSCTDETCEPDDWNLAAGGAHTTIVANVPFASVASSNPSVATFSVFDGNLEIEAYTGSPGSTQLDALDETGQVVASATVVVEATASLQLGGGPNSIPNPALVLEGAPQLFHVVTKDADGRSTRGDGSVAFQLTGTLSNAVLPIDGDEVGFVGTPGAGNITATCPNASITEAITVVPAAAITSLQTGYTTGIGSLGPNVSSFTAAGDGTVSVVVTATSANGEVYAGPCAWTTSDPSVTLTTQLASSLDLDPNTISVFEINRAGSFTATCTLAGLSATVTLNR